MDKYKNRESAIKYKPRFKEALSILKLLYSTQYYIL